MVAQFSAEASLRIDHAFMLLKRMTNCPMQKPSLHPWKQNSSLLFKRYNFGLVLGTFYVNCCINVYHVFSWNGKVGYILGLLPLQNTKLQDDNKSLGCLTKSKEAALLEAEWTVQAAGNKAFYGRRYSK